MAETALAPSKNSLHETTEFLELFLRNHILNGNHLLHNWTLHCISVECSKNLKNRTLVLQNRTLKG